MTELFYWKELERRARAAQALARAGPVLQQTRESANIHAGLGFNWRIPVNGDVRHANKTKSQRGQ
jgi:hypothetical protein